MRITFDPNKNERNLRERGLSFEAVAAFDFDGALIRVDDRRPYGETRYVAIGWLHGRLHVLCFTEAPGGDPGDQFAPSQFQRSPPPCPEPDR